MKRRYKWLGVAAGILLCAGIAGCMEWDRVQPVLVRIAIKPQHDFSAASTPPAPNYAEPDAWADLPGRASAADVTPAGFKDRQASAGADVFFIYPTTYFSRKGWNAPFGETGSRKGMGVPATLRNQASAFASCCRIYAPRYRQATLYAFLDPSRNAKAALDLAYRDVARAFDYYMAHDNHGRPFILAGHSQGSLHLMRLLQQKIAGRPAQKRLIAAYAVGSFLPSSVTTQIPACDKPDQTGCVINWNSVGDVDADRTRGGTALMWTGGQYRQIGRRPLLCVNPLNWRVGGAAPASANSGALMGAGDGPAPALKPAFTGAKCEKGLLITSPPKDQLSRLARDGVYHIYDYNLFYANIRANARRRAEAFAADH